MLEKIKKYLTDLTKIDAMPGHEKDIRNYIIKNIGNSKYEITNLGNLLVYFDGKDNSKKPLLVDAHMDEVGFMVKYIESDGFIRISNYGGVDPRVVASQKLLVHSRNGKKFLGITGVLPPHATGLKDLKVIDIEDLFLDCGFKSDKEVYDNNIRPGAQVSFYSEYHELENNLFTTKAIDDRIGCAILLCLCDELKNKTINRPCVLSFSVQEEGGLRGAVSVSNIVKPEYALIIEATTACDMHSVANHKKIARIGKGAAFSVVDGYTHFDPELVDMQVNIAIKNNIKYQFKTPKAGGTNAGMIHIHGEGVKCAVCALPARYLHSAVSLASWDDVNELYKFSKAFIYNF